VSVTAEQARTGRHDRKQLAHVVEQHGVTVEIDRARRLFALRLPLHVEPSPDAISLILQFVGGNVYVAAVEFVALRVAKLRQAPDLDLQPI